MDISDGYRREKKRKRLPLSSQVEMEITAGTELRKDERKEETNLKIFRHEMRSGDLLAYLFLNGSSSNIVLCW